MFPPMTEKTISRLPCVRVFYDMPDPAANASSLKRAFAINVEATMVFEWIVMACT